MSLQERQRAQARELVGDVPRMSSIASMDPTADPASAVQINGRRSSLSHGRLGVNMPAVAEVLERYNLDPLEEMAKVLTETKQVLDRDGKPVLDADGKPLTERVLGPKERALVAAELIQYTRPKLKATEVTLKPPEQTDDQVDHRLAALMQTGRR